MSFRAAFDLMCNKKSRSGSIIRIGTDAVTAPITYSPTNYQRNLQGPSDTVFEGREFIITKTALDASTFNTSIKRGDRLRDSDLGDMVIREVIEMYDNLANIIGFRLRTD